MKRRPRPPQPTDPPDDPIQSLIDTAAVVTALARAIYADGRLLSREIAAPKIAWLYLEQRRACNRLAAAVRSAIDCDFAPRAGLADVEQRADAFQSAAERMLAWAFAHRGRQPPPWPANEKEAEDPAAVPD
jgi:hypothetical protein